MREPATFVRVSRIVSMLKMSVLKRAKAGAKRRRKPPVIDEEERILREATKHLVFHHGMFLVATGLREVRIRGFRAWIITVTMRLGAEPTSAILSMTARTSRF